MINVFSRLNEGGIGTNDIICVDGVTMSVERVRWGYMIQVLENTSSRYYLYEGFKTVLSEGFVEMVCSGEYSFKSLCYYYLGYNPDKSIRKIMLYDLLLKGVYNND